MNGWLQSYLDREQLPGECLVVRKKLGHVPLVNPKHAHRGKVENNKRSKEKYNISAGVTLKGGLAKVEVDAD